MVKISPGDRISILIVLWLPALALPAQRSIGQTDRVAEPATAFAELREDTVEIGLELLEALRLTLENDPNIELVEAQLEASHGALTVTRGDFDPVLTASVEQNDSQIPLDTESASDSSSLSQSVGLTQLLRSGLSLTPSVELQRDDDAGPAVDTATVSFTLRQPLLRDRGRAVVTANEQAAELEVEAGELELEHTVAQRLAVVADRYWRVRAAALDLDILRTTEKRSRELLATTRRLVAADVTPAAEIVQLEADLTSREIDRIAGERSLFRAHQNLGLEIGLEADQIRDLGVPSDFFPTVDPARVPPTQSPLLLNEAMARRADLAAARQRLAAAEIQRQAAANALKPRLDLLFTPSYSGFADGGGAGEIYAPLFDNVPGLSTSFGLSLSWPTLNRRAEGQRVQADASVRQSALRVDLVTRSIGAEVPAALDAVRRVAEQLSRLDRAVALFEKTLENEIKKLSAGSSTVIDVITQRDRLTSVRQRRVATQLALALALIDLRFETGTLYRGGPSARTIRSENLTTLPF